MKTVEYIEKLRDRAKTPTVYAIAKLLDLPENNVRNYAKGRRCFDPLAATKVAEVLNLPPMQVIADAEAERETDEKRRDYWRDLARKLAGSTATLVFTIAMLVSTGLLTSQDAMASEGVARGFNTSTFYTSAEYKLYA